MRDESNLDRPCSHQIVIQPLKGKSVQIHEVARHVNTHDETAFAGFYRAENEALYEECAALGQGATFDNPAPVSATFDPVDQAFNISEIVLPQT